MLLWKNKYAQWLFLFLGIMVGLTVVSRAADSITIAKVTTQKAVRGTLIHQVNAEGTIKAAEKIYIQSPAEGFAVQKIHIAEGEHVEKGQVLFTLDGKEAQGRLEELENERTRLTLELQKLQVGESSQQAEVESAQKELERAQADGEFRTMLNDGKQLQEDQRAIEDAKEELARAQKNLQKQLQNQAIDAQIRRLEIENQEREIRKLQEICEAGGVVTAEKAGTVEEIFVKEGNQTAGTALCTVIPEDAEFLLQAEIPTENAKYMKIGDALTLTFLGKSRSISGVNITSLQNKDEMTVINAIIDKELREKEGEMEWKQGAAVTVAHESVSEEYPVVIPLQALRGSEGDYYVLIKQTSNTVLGKETLATKVSVQLLDKDQQRAAIEGAFTDEVIFNENKPIMEGDRIREAAR